jgi:hypothetical protein
MNMRTEVLMAKRIKVTVLWNMTLGKFEDTY